MTTTLPTVGLPRAALLTDALVAPAGPAPGEDAVGRLRRDLIDALAVRSSGRPIRVDAYRLGSFVAQSEPGGFRWSARTARRTIGVAAVARCVAGRSGNPSDAVSAELEHLVRTAATDRTRSGTLGTWLARLPKPGRLAVCAEARSWATHLFTAIEWHRLPPGSTVGRPDRWWDCPGVSPVAIRGRADVRVPVGGTDTGAASLLTVAGGRPTATSPVELGLAALVDAVREPTGPVPARVIGWWPGCGRALVLPVDLTLLRRTADAVVEAALVGP